MTTVPTLRDMPTALICTVGTTLEGRTDILDALSDEIRGLGPAQAIFIVSHQSKPNAEQVAAAISDGGPEVGYVQLTSSHDLNEAFTRTSEAIRLLLSRGFTSDQIFVNYTSGTKVMSAGAVMAAVFHQCQQLRYLYQVTASSPNELVTTRPEAVFAYRDLLLASSLIREMRFTSAVDLLSRIDRTFLFEGDAQSVDALRETALAYQYWDTFRPVDFISKMQSLPADNDMVACFKVSDPVLAMLAEIARAMQQRQYSPLTFADMMNNARRRQMEGNLDDAAARVYRALEMLAQWVLLRYDINTNDVDTRRVPPRYRVAYEAMRSMDDGVVRIGMRKSYDLLAILGAPLGHRFAENSDMVQLLQSRGDSILAHGTKSISDDECSRLIAAAHALFSEEIAEFDTLCRSLQFPWLGPNH